MKEDITYICKLSSKLTEREKEDFLNVFNEVFSLDYDMDWFRWKYMDNIYGDSYMVLAYQGDKAVGARSFWRNDIDGHLCYQPCDTGVVKEARGRGIFSKMTLMALDETKDGFIYNYPNDNSRPGYLKLGWKINKYYYMKLVMSNKNLEEESKYIEDDYLLWRFAKSPINKYFYCEKGGQSYLLVNRKNNIYYVLGRFKSEYGKYFTKVNSPILFNYTTKETMMYKLFKNKATIVSFEREGQDSSKIDIPIFKGDHF
ncbi:GNAT family N-acetyltransferase [Clostridium sp. Cult3]|mgnify:CR=1 FL=1|uniref:GNAT family N-acetyltransferase n=1 Tax=Clostridium sp. Cult3 TaxID=2079004 RepID=UPI001F15F7C1|nr:GNAT family N-acetyltransferase [Clostridium sp. Cult3]MCF6460448.1 hypothetical protein [Clostridium sp. Cult3]